MMEKVKIGKVVNTRGIRGEIKLVPYSNVENLFERLEKVSIGEETVSIEDVKHVKTTVILKLKNIETPEEAQGLVGKLLYADQADMPALEKDNYYVKDILSSKVYTVDGEYLGRLTNVFFTGANDVYEVATEQGKKILIPAVREFIKEVDPNGKKMVVRLIDGMLP